MESIIYNDNKYVRRKDGYYRKTTGDRKLLHRQVWEDSYGPLPRGMVIHHLDGNPSNNDISNLAAMPQNEHASMHKPMPDDGLSQYQRFYRNHHEQDKQRARDYYAAHREERVKYSREYRDKKKLERSDKMAVERICPNCTHFYETGRSEWEDHPKCEDCTRRGGVDDNFKAKEEAVDNAD